MVSCLMFTLGKLYARCTPCAIDFGVTHGGHNDVTAHSDSI